MIINDNYAVLGYVGESSILAVSEQTDTAGNLNETLAGKLNLAVYEEAGHDVVLVPINGNTAQAAAIQTRLNDIYAQAAVNFQVIAYPNTFAPQDWDEDNDDKIACTGTGMLSNYTGDMNTVISAYKDAHNINRDAFYLFLATNPASGNKLGQMPLKRRYGFIFLDNNGSLEEQVHTIAHELGHGAFRLRHTFSEHPTLTKGTTNNLMDYSDSTHLFKYQWDYIHDPEAMMALWQDEEEGASYSILDVKKSIEKIRYGYVKNKSITFIGDIRNVFYANNVKLLNGKIIDEIVFVPNKSGEIKINPKEYKNSGNMSILPDLPTGKESIVFYENGNAILKILFTANNEADINEFKNYMFPIYNKWSNQIYQVKKEKTIPEIDIKEEYKIEVEENNGETAIYKTSYTIESNSKKDNEFRVYKQGIFFLIKLAFKPEIRLISEYKEEYIYSFKLDDGSIDLVSKEPTVKTLPYIELPEFNNRKNVLFADSPTEAYNYVSEEEPLVLAFYDILNKKPELAKTGGLPYLALLDKLEQGANTLNELILIVMENTTKINRTPVVSYPNGNLNDIIGSPPDFNKTKTYIIKKEEIDNAIKEYKGIIKSNNTNDGVIIN
jgi:hypothetical protein